MDERQKEIQRLEEQIRRWKAWSNRPGTKIYYAQRKIESLRKEKPKPPPVKTVKHKVRKLPKPPQAKACPENTAFVLHREAQDLIRAIEALERLR